MAAICEEAKFLSVVVLRSTNCWLDRPAICAVVKACNCVLSKLLKLTVLIVATSRVSSAAT